MSSQARSLRISNIQIEVHWWEVYENKACNIVTWALEYRTEFSVGTGAAGCKKSTVTKITAVTKITPCPQRIVFGANWILPYSDALLMNIFCYPGVTRRREVCLLLGTKIGDIPQFEFMPRVPLVTSAVERTEVDMKLGDVLFQSKPTEGNLQTQNAAAYALNVHFCVYSMHAGRIRSNTGIGSCNAYDPQLSAPDARYSHGRNWCLACHRHYARSCT